MQPKTEDVDEELPSTLVIMRAGAHESPPPRMTPILSASAVLEKLLVVPLFSIKVLKLKGLSKPSKVSNPRSVKL